MINFKSANTILLSLRKSVVFFNSKWFYVLFFIIIFVFANVRQKRITNFDCEICADKAGYYMYLPATFHMGFRAENYPESFDQKHGDGFFIDRTNNKIITKFSSGVALLQAPFYGLGALIAKLLSLDVLPYSQYYLFFINIGAAFYALLGLYFFKKWLDNYVSAFSAFLSMLLIFFGTNLYYYTLDESLMSHLYSFSMFAIILYTLKTYCQEKGNRYFLIFSVSLAIAILIRPTNVLFGLIAFFFDIRTIDDLKVKANKVFTLKNLLFGTIIFLLIMLPQFLYWNFAFGKYIVWSYQGEGFSYWNNPQFLIVWFSPQSGLFTYTPIIIISLVFSFIMLKNKIPNAALIIVTFLAVSYLCASWSNPYFGICNFGKRPMVEYLPVIMMPVAFLLENYKTYKKLKQFALTFSLILLVYYNLTLFTAFNTCFFGQTWEWEKFLDLLKKALLWG